MASPNRDIEFVRTLSYDALGCRTIRHQWELVFFGPARKADPPSETDFKSANLRRAQCLRCGAFREEFFNEINKVKFLNGEPFSAFYRRYYYEEGYLYKRKPSVDKPAAKDYHYELYRRLNK